MTERKLTPKQAAFVREYLIDLNATQAAIRAGYSVRTASSIAEENLRKPEIKAGVQAAMAERGERLKASADDVLREITRLAMIDVGRITEVTGPADIKALPEDVRRAIVGWSWDKNGNFTIKLAKEGALEMMGRHHALFKEKLELSGEISLAARMRKRAQGA